MDEDQVPSLRGQELPNAASEGLHRAAGFTPVGVYRGVGYKRGAWHDVLDAYVPPAGTSRTALTPGLLHDRMAERLDDAEPAGRALSRLADRALYSAQPCSAEDGALAWRSARQVRRALRQRSRH